MQRTERYVESETMNVCNGVHLNGQPSFVMGVHTM